MHSAVQLPFHQGLNSEDGNFYLKPFFDLDVSYLFSEYSESLTVSSFSNS